MNFTVILDNLHRRVAAILTVSVVGLGLGWVITSNFIIRGVADRRVVLPYEWLAAAEERFPNSARVNFRLAETEIAAASGKGQFDAQAETHAARAVNLSPWDYQARRLLATTQEVNGKLQDAENSLRAAVRLAPNHAELNWSFANLLLRRGKLDESLEPFRVAAKSDAGLLPQAVETIWRSSGGNLDTLKTFAGTDAESLLAIVKFLTEQNLVAEAVPIFNSIDKQAKVNSSQSPELIAALMRAGQLGLAKTAWVDLMTALQPEAQMTAIMGANGFGLIWNGGFEMDAVRNLGHFDWAIRPNQYARIVIDENFARSGGRSLKVVFSGLDTTTLSNQVQQAIVLKPGASYRLECYAKVEGLVTPAPPGGPRIAVIGQGAVIATSDPVMSDSSGWQRLVVSFVAPANSQTALVSIVRTPKFSYDDPTRGIIWFDDFTLVEQ
ncbi:MAG: tetratricopeptide repeat protein [Blastocatellales bacterium]